MILYFVKLIDRTKHPVQRGVMGSRAPRHQEGVNTADIEVMGMKTGTSGLRAGEDTEGAGWIRTSGSYWNVESQTPSR